MRIHARALIAAVILLGAGCTSVFTVDDVVSESAAIRNDQVIGDWREADGDEQAHVAHGMNNDYIVSYLDGSDSVQLRARLGRLGQTMVVDFFPDLALWRQRNENGFPTHSVFSIEIRGDSIGLRGLNADSVQALLPTASFRVPFTIADGDLLLHGDPAGVRAALRGLFQQRRVLEKAVWYKRVANRPDSAAAKAERNAMIAVLRSMLTSQEVFFSDSTHYASKVSSLPGLRLPTTITVQTFVGGAQFWNAIITSSRLPGVECAVAVNSINPLSSAAAEGEPICR